jgi:hypothetical protein
MRMHEPVSTSSAASPHPHAYESTEPAARPRNRRSSALAAGALALAVAAPTAAEAGGATERTMVGVGAEFGYQTLLGSNGKAFAASPAIRIQGEVHPADAYIVQLIYGFASHGLNDPTSLFVEPSAAPDWSGAMDLHTINVGFKGFADLGQSRLQWFRPYMSSSMGAIWASSTLDSAAVPSLYDTSASWGFDFDTSVGVEINLKYIALGVFGRGGLIPKFSKTDAGNRLEMLWPVSFGLAGSLAI